MRKNDLNDKIFILSRQAEIFHAGSLIKNREAQEIERRNTLECLKALNEEFLTAKQKAVFTETLDKEIIKNQKLIESENKRLRKTSKQMKRFAKEISSIDEGFSKFLISMSEKQRISELLSR